MVTAERQRIEIEDDEAYSREEAQRRLGSISKQTFGELVKQGRIRVVRAGRRVLVPRSSIIAFLSTDDDNRAA